MTDAKQALEVVDELRAAAVIEANGKRVVGFSRTLDLAASLLSSLAEENERLRGDVTRWKDVSASAIKCLATTTDMLESISPHPMMTAGFGAATRELRRIHTDLTTHPAKPEGEGHE